MASSVDEQLRAVLVCNLEHGGALDFADRVGARGRDASPELVCNLDLTRERSVPPDFAGDPELARALEVPCDPQFGARSDKERDRNPVAIPDLVRDLGPNDVDSQDLRDEEDRGNLVEIAPGFRPGSYRGRGGGFLSRSGARTPAMADAGGFSGIHRLRNRNKAPDFGLQCLKGMSSNSLDVVSDCGVDCNQKLEVLGRSTGGTQPVRRNATVEKNLDSAAMVPAVLPVVDGRESALDFQPPAAGVGLEQYISAALLSRKSSSKGTNSGGLMRNLAGHLGSAVSCDDPFPPLPRLAGDMGTGGDSATSRSSQGAEDKLQGDRDIAGKRTVDGDAIKYSWTDLLRTSKPDNVCVDLHYVEPTIIDGEACAVFSLEEEAENLMQWQNTLLCYVVGKSPTYYQFLKAMQRQWNPPGELEIFSRENGIFFCKFGSKNDMKKVIKDGPWYMDGKLVVVKRFTGDTNCEEDMLSSIPIWVKLPSLPVKWWSIEGVSKVVSPLGHPLYFDLTSASKSRIAYARCCVEISMEKTLPDSVLCMGGDKVKKRQSILYDWVPKRCSACKEFGHVVAECGGSQPRYQQEGKDVRLNNKKMGLRQQTYVPKEKNQIIAVEGQVEINSKKKEDVAGKEKNKKMNEGSNGAIYKTNLLHNRMETIKASSANSFQLLMGLEKEDKRDELEDGIKGNHTYFSSDEEVDEDVDLAPLKEANLQKTVNGEVISSVVVTLVSDPCPTINEMQVQMEDVASKSADDDPRERDARGSGKKSEIELQSEQGNNMEGDLNKDKQGSDDDDQDQESETEEEGIQNYGKQPAECGMPLTLTVVNPKYKGEIDVLKESKKEKKKRSTPAPERPAGSRTTRHSFRVG